MLFRAFMIWLLLAPVACAQPAAVRSPAPSQAALESATKLIADVYKKEYEAAKTPLQKQAFGKKLLDDALKTKEDPTAQFALLDVARKVAAQSGDVDLAYSVADSIVARFDVPETALRANVLLEVGQNLRAPEAYFFFGRFADRLFPALQAAALWKEGIELAKLGEDAALKNRDGDFSKVWAERRTQWLALQKVYVASEPAIKQLQKLPTDPALNDTVGRLHCFLLEDWSTGLPMLALGNDVELQKLAERELRVESVSDRLTLADDWSALAEKFERYDRLATLRHAFELYKQAEEKLEGLPKSRAKKRLLETFAEGMPARTPLAVLPFTSETKIEGIVHDIFVGKVAGRRFPNTLIGHPPSNGSSRLAFDLPDGSEYLVGMCAFNDMHDDHPHNPVMFRVTGDGGRELWNAGKRWHTLNKAFPFKVDVRGQKRIELQVECFGFNGASHAIWVEPLLQR